jgi:hypothetical protein
MSKLPPVLRQILQQQPTKDIPAIKRCIVPLHRSD